ncbi:DUF4258 domain-containing protein [Mesohalobacter halotolerans]|uniref:DUF4258 domain-containing protein n=1 Tax=Mesohalobacter halotolerans TaxID=1883405 RepID=A0A4U5TR86_9FLAO|nr:DUF4258 domain-containing protein [Mesohalobacter halotolerans]MBS3737846.1 DUF4258 domain-containing protein [Psychroflexus sp.]TKS56749.1 DUF4258 domain-containing protein [Mesohalobacter halotolerans]
MSLKKRLLYFAIGLSIGLVFVKIIFDKKDVSFDYFPNDRVLKTLRTKQRNFDDKALIFFREHTIDTSLIEEFLTSSDVNFKKSQQRKKPCSFYQIEAKHQNDLLAIQVKNCDTLVTIQNAFKINEK